MNSRYVAFEEGLDAIIESILERKLEEFHSKIITSSVERVPVLKHQNLGQSVKEDGKKRVSEESASLVKINMSWFNRYSLRFLKKRRNTNEILSISLVSNDRMSSAFHYVVKVSQYLTK